MTNLAQTPQHTQTSQAPRSSLLSKIALPFLQAGPTIGGQAVMEGVMMRNQDKLSIAVRKPNGEIVVETRPWFTLLHRNFMKKPFIRGFPVLVETMVNGIKALNYSASIALEPENEEEQTEELKPWHLVATLIFSIAMALLLFVVVPHLFSIGMKFIGLGGDVEGFTFHMWDGFFKLAIFLGYILAISLIPDIRRVFQYHGAEHKVVWAYEKGNSLDHNDPAGPMAESRLHPRCGTTFMLFVLSISIVLHAVLVPLLLAIYAPESYVFKHVYIVIVKLFLVIPISCLAYEAIKFAGTRGDNFFCKLLNGPGLLLQMLTTHEPDSSQVEVAVAALKGALVEEVAEKDSSELEHTDTLQTAESST